ncbi:2-isopropylmalate synthase [Serratia microhaemolytica]|uniref:2-isopropylmalate synthase n=1 Tax=Serratia microhaemolytica TaxID=2675110 RepID=UPI000FDDF9E2|nr:2-isopropylmalate synthase [Serratia microhaemolytica]
MSIFDYRKYSPYTPVKKHVRRWPDKIIQKAPVWCSVDLRDGNQALIEPLAPTQKLEFFNLLVDIGLKEIEVGFPAASKPDFDFVRQLIEEGLIPNDVTIQVLTQAREELIAKTFEALKGANSVIIHLYNSTSVIQREQVFCKSKQEIKEIAVQGAVWVKEYAMRQPETKWQFQYSPESFTGTELEYAVEVCNAVNAVWEPTPSSPVIINLPATVEMSTPNVYADQIEWMCDHIAQRDSIIISLHTHNDRGCAIAAAELGLMAGADRIEGTLLGNGERTGNMDIVIAAMNLYSQGIDPQLNLMNIDRIIQTVESCTQLKVHPRHPYVGELVFAAFSGSHQDAINKCLAKYQQGETWRVAYLPIDPRDVGRTYQEVIRINSQSGKGGIGYVLASKYGWQLPRWMQVDFSPVVQYEAERIESEVSVEVIYALFKNNYLNINNAWKIGSFNILNDNKIVKLYITLTREQCTITIQADGQGPLEAFVRALTQQFGYHIDIVSYNEHTLGVNENSEAITYIQANINGQRYCAAGQSRDIVQASFLALLNAIAKYERIKVD